MGSPWLTQGLHAMSLVETPWGIKRLRPWIVPQSTAAMAAKLGWRKMIMGIPPQKGRPDWDRAE